MRKRDIQAQRQAKEAMKKTGWAPPELMQDDSRELSVWSATQPDAGYIVRSQHADDKPFPLSDGSPINPADAWPVPQQKEAK